MVSIPDWSRFRRGPPAVSPLSNQRQMTPRERYIRAMEREAILEASRKGYFLEPSKEQVIDTFGETYGAEDPMTGLPMQKTMQHVNHIRFSHQHMKIVADIGMFSRITILILDHNFLESIDDLASCKELIKLDIHSNQLSFLPDSHFWSRMTKLRVLLAHDNPIGRVEPVHSLVACPRLNVLTLYDSPLSLKKNYRHHVVNTIWTLKALDHHVISDEEIIEDAVFKGTRFVSYSRQFEIDLSHPQTKVGATFSQELASVRILMSNINRVMAHYCPVLIIQKNIRFWLTYRRYSLYQESRVWAVITVQRAWRQYKNLNYEPPEDVTSLISTQGVTTPNRLPTISKPRESSISTRMDGIGTPSRRHRYNRDRKLPNIFVDMNKLFKVSTEREDSLNELQILVRAHKMAPKKIVGKVPGKRAIPDPPQPPGRRPFLHQSLFFGEVVQSDDLPHNHKSCLPTNLPQTSEPYTTENLPIVQSGYRTMLTEPTVNAEDEVPVIEYRLKGVQHRMASPRPYEEGLLLKKEAGQDIREVETSFHDRAAAQTPPLRIKRDAAIKSKFLFERVQQTMALSCLTAVQQAYRDREIDEIRILKSQDVTNMKEQQEQAKERIKLYQFEKRLVVQNNRHDDRRTLRERYENNEKLADSYMSKSLLRRQMEKEHKERRKNEMRFSREFRTQHTSVSKALKKHDRQLHKDTHLHHKMETVENLKDVEREQQEIVKKYLQHRTMLRQTENSMGRAALDTKMLQDANDRVYQAKTRVAQKKQMTSTVQKYVSVPVTRGAEDIPDASRQPAPNNFVKLTEEIANKRKQDDTKSMFQFYLPRSNSYIRPDTRLTMSGMSRLHANVRPLPL